MEIRPIYYDPKWSLDQMINARHETIWEYTNLVVDGQLVVELNCYKTLAWLQIVYLERCELVQLAARPFTVFASAQATSV